MSVNTQTLMGNWHEIKGKLKEKWGDLTQDDLRAFSGNVEQLVGRIERRTGESRDAIMEFLDELSDEGAGLVNAASEKIGAAAEQVADTAKQGYDALRDGYSQAEDMVKARPMQSFALAFAAGIVAGLGVSLVLRRDPSPTSRGRDLADHIGKRVSEALAAWTPDVLRKHS